MKKEELQTALKEAGVSEEAMKEINVDKLNSTVNEDTNKVVASKKEGFLQEGRDLFLKEQGFENVEKFTSFKETANSSESELNKKITKLESEKDEINNKYVSLQGKVQDEKEVGILTNTGEKGFKVNPEFGEFVHSKFKTAREKAKTENKEIKIEEWAKDFLEKNDQFVVKTSTGTRFRGQPSPPVGKQKTEDFYAERYKNRRKK